MNKNEFLHINYSLGSAALRLLEEVNKTSWLRGSKEDERVSFTSAKVQIKSGYTKYF